MKDHKLTGWQKDVISHIEGHASLRESDSYQGLPDFMINKELCITASFPRQSGHTTFANYLASKYPSIVVYRDIKHYVSLTQAFPLHGETDMVSMFEISFALTEATQHTSKDIEDLKQRFSKKKVVIVDGVDSLPARVKSFLLDVSSCCVVFLGKS